MKKLRKMDSTGDTVIEFDEAEASAKATQEAKALFERMMAGGGAVFAIGKTGEADTQVRKFQDLAHDNVIVPKIVGG